MSLIINCKICLPSLWSHPNESHDTFNDEHKAGNYEPFPKVGRMKYDQKPEWNVHQVSPVEDFEASTATNKRQRANEHDHENADEKKSRWISPAVD